MKNNELIHDRIEEVFVAAKGNPVTVFSAYEHIIYGALEDADEEALQMIKKTLDATMEHLTVLYMVYGATECAHSSKNENSSTKGKQMEELKEHIENGCSYGQQDGPDDVIKECDC